MEEGTKENGSANGTPIPEASSDTTMLFIFIIYSSVSFPLIESFLQNMLSAWLVWLSFYQGQTLVYGSDVFAMKAKQSKYLPKSEA